MIIERFLGGEFDDFLREEGIIDDAESITPKRVIAFQIAEEMKRSHITKTELVQRMKTSRPVVDRLLDPSNRSITLSTLGRAASAVGKTLKIELCGRHSQHQDSEDWHIVIRPAEIPARR